LVIEHIEKPVLVEPQTKNAIVFIDGQNLFHSIRNMFGYSFPNYDITKLANMVNDHYKYKLKQIRFYTGIPVLAQDPKWHRFWTNKLRRARREGVYVFTRELRQRWKYHDIWADELYPYDKEYQIVVRRFCRRRFDEPFPYRFDTHAEKGIDARIVIDVIRLAIAKEYDVAIIFSQDQDLSEAAKELPVIAREQNRWIKVISAFPIAESPCSNDANFKGINNTDWYKFSKNEYVTCIDEHEYLPKQEKLKFME